MDLMLKVVLVAEDEEVLYSGPARSYVKFWLDLLNRYEKLDGVCNTNCSGAGAINAWRVDAPADDDTYGILIGSDNTPPTPNDTDLKSKITKDIMSHDAVSVSGVTVEASQAYFKVSRLFTNVSGGDVNVGETGMKLRRYMHARRKYWNYTRDDRYLIARDVFNPVITVPDGASLRIEYTFRVRL